MIPIEPLDCCLSQGVVPRLHKQETKKGKEKKITTWALPLTFCLYLESSETEYYKCRHIHYFSTPLTNKCMACHFHVHSDETSYFETIYFLSVIKSATYHDCSSSGSWPNLRWLVRSTIKSRQASTFIVLPFIALFQPQHFGDLGLAKIRGCK